MADVNLPLSGPVTQTFAPWAANYVTVNVGSSTDPEAEKVILSVASYGKQLGRIGDALLVLLRHLPADAVLLPEEKDAICDLKTMLREIATVKHKHRQKSGATTQAATSLRNM